MLMLLLTATAGADIYVWTDANGVKHFSNEPPPDARQVKQQEEITHDPDQYKTWESQRKEALEKAMESDADADGKANRSRKPPHRQAARRSVKVIMYATLTCGYCMRARMFFAEHGIAYTEHDISSDPQARKRFEELNGRGVPLIFIGDQRISGFNPDQLKHALDIK